MLVFLLGNGCATTKNENIHDDKRRRKMHSAHTMLVLFVLVLEKKIHGVLYCERLTRRNPQHTLYE